MIIGLKKDLVPLRAMAVARVDAQAEIERGRYATAGALQAMTYQAKSAEAAAYLTIVRAGDYPLLGVGIFPLLEAEAAATETTVSDLAATVAATAAAWTAITAAIEAKRMAAKKAVREASTPAAIDAVVVDWTIT